jgi:competence protein ComEC
MRHPTVKGVGVAAAIGQADETEAGFVKRQLRLQEGSAVLWSPVFLTIGIWAYFALPLEPGWTLFFGVSLVLAVLLVTGAGRRGFFLGFALVLAGFLLAKVQVVQSGTPLLPATTGKVEISGIVQSIERKTAKRGVVVLNVTQLDQVKTDVRPHKVRLSANQLPEGLSPGQTIRAQAYLRPLPSPVMPGGFDYGRVLFLEGIGATGQFSGEITIADARIPFAYWVRHEINILRIEIGRRIADVLPPGRSGFAEALITGERGAIPKNVTESLQVSGLGHILSISGLHMSLVAGGVFWLVRALLALSQHLTLHRPIKKWAAGAALAAGFGYMLLAGADVATQRSYIMLAIIFFAIIADRPAISMRNLALAALIILVTQPASALSAGFHMSFMAVMGLAAFYEALSSWQAKRDEMAAHGRVRRMAGKVSFSLFIMLATTLVAGTLSSIPAAYHFGRLSPLSLLANALALPLLSFIVMPAATLSVVLMPLGLETLPLWVMGVGLEGVLLVSDWVAALPMARSDVALFPSCQCW